MPSRRDVQRNIVPLIIVHSVDNLAGEGERIGMRAQQSQQADSRYECGSEGGGRVVGWVTETRGRERHAEKGVNCTKQKMERKTDYKFREVFR